MMAEKARTFSDQETLERILSSDHPREAKTLGRAVKNYDEAKWNEMRFAAVVQGSVHKFSQNAGLRQELLGTGDQILVEASPEDRIWGIGLREGDPDAMVPARWNGKNLLGFALMEARERLRHE